jgi:hypothetical protein
MVESTMVCGPFGGIYPYPSQSVSTNLVGCYRYPGTVILVKNEVGFIAIINQCGTKCLTELIDNYAGQSGGIRSKSTLSDGTDHVTDGMQADQACGNFKYRWESSWDAIVSTIN